MKSVFIIAEAGVNHNGSVERAKDLIDEATRAGTDAVKFQTFRAEQIARRNAPKAEYQKRTTGAVETQFEMLKRLELNESDHRVLIQHCQLRGIKFISTPFDLESLKLLQRLDVSPIKISSGDITNAPLLLETARTGRPIILSTGMSTAQEIEMALGILAFGYFNKQKPSLQAFQEAYTSASSRELLKQKVRLLHCTSEYPAPMNEINLKAIPFLQKAFGLPVGLSDHSTGIVCAVAAVALGAVVIEKHFTLSRTLEGPDHGASLEPIELKEMITSIRDVEKALGEENKAPTSSERKNLEIIRKSLVAAKSIKKGEMFTEDNLTIKRPGVGIPPLHYWEWLKKRSNKDYEPDGVIE